MKHDDLFLCLHIFNSDDDSEVVEDIFVGFDKSLNLVLLLLHTDYGEPEYNCQTYAVIDKDEAFKLSKRLRVAMAQLPDPISESIEEHRRLVNPTLKQTRDCFSDTLNFVIKNGGRLRLRRTFGAYGYTCF